MQREEPWSLFAREVYERVVAFFMFLQNCRMHRLIVNRISVIYVFIVMLCHNGYGQARVVFNNGYMKIDMGAFLVIDNPNANAIVNPAAK